MLLNVRITLYQNDPTEGNDGSMVEGNLIQMARLGDLETEIRTFLAQLGPAWTASVEIVSGEDTD